jgi:hypothetical protein
MIHRAMMNLMMTKPHSPVDPIEKYYQNQDIIRIKQIDNTIIKMDKKEVFPFILPHLDFDRICS